MANEEFRGETGAERRRYPRMPIKLQVSYKCIEKGIISKPEAYLAEDLGAGGLAMRSPRSLDSGQMLMLNLFLPPADTEGTDKNLSIFTEEECVMVGILSRVAWCTAFREEGYLIGVQFLDLDRDDRRRLKDFLTNFQLDAPDSSLYT